MGLLHGSEEDARVLIDNPLGIYRRVGIAAAMRRQDRTALEKAKSSQDEETRKLADHAVEFLDRREHWIKRGAARGNDERERGGGG
jgi:hypothetical protein